MAFLYQIPIAIVRVAADGAVKMLTPRAAALLQRFARTGTFDNIFHIIDPVAPEIHHLVCAFTGKSGVVCEEFPVVLDGCDDNSGSLVLEVSIQKITADELMIVFTDITRQKRAEEQLSNLAAIVESSDDAIVVKNHGFSTKPCLGGCFFALKYALYPIFRFINTNVTSSIQSTTSASIRMLTVFLIGR